MYKRSAFSLIELMVVIAIVALLAAVATPAYKNYIQAAKITSASEIIQIFADKAWELYEMGTPPESIGMADLGIVSTDPFSSNTPDTVQDYVFPPYVAQLSITGNNYEPGQCARITMAGYISNTDGIAGVTTANNLPYIYYYYDIGDVNGVKNTFCYFGVITAPFGAPDTTFTMPNCFNSLAPGFAAEADAFNALLTTCP